ncbi:phosphodiester glycosidase family protein [Schinkia azotoformans]|uniref:stalk domain-containing protein n=1 Tax=Schinkia azotoformans TaxID=1454 RepID=UPI002E1AAC1C|nr:phosphodiester glycosidase family protein [Schinkia azotoformans]
MGFKRFILVFFIIGVFSFFNHANTAGAEGTALLDIDKGRTYVPIRFVTEQFGAEVTWNGEDRTVLINNQSKTVILKIGDQKVEVNKRIEQIDAPPFIKDSITYVPLRFISTVLGTEPVWEPKTSTVKIELNKKVITLSTIPYNSKTVTKINGTKGSSITETVKSFKVGAKTFKANVITVDLNDPALDLKVAIAKDRVGQVESLASIAKRNGAVIAINGTFFDAYTESKEPYGMIIADGKIVCVGKERTVFSFDADNNVSFGIMNPEIKGSTNGSDVWPNNWYSYWLNRTPSFNAAANVVVFTPDWGDSLGFPHGTNVIVENGKVKEIVTDKDVKIPKNGFVINLMGSEVHTLLSRFTVGTTVDYEVVENSNKLESIDGAIAAGPRLVTDGKITVDFDKEGFKDPKIRTQSDARSAIGITKDQKLIFLTTTSTIIDLAEIMKQAGAYQAMNLDGGASSGLYYNDKYIWTPDREISNAILVIKK